MTNPDGRNPDVTTQALPVVSPPLPPRPGQVPLAGPEQAEPVRWLSPSQLVRTAIEVVQGTIFARFADKREVMGGVPAVVFKLDEGSDQAWFDYVADTGDGFNATFATARSVMRTRNLTYEPDAHGVVCPCAEAGRDLVVLGGDEVYPTASAKDYAVKLHAPFEEARLLHQPHTGDPDPLFEERGTPVLALPGNHDWYDGLVAFRRVFCESWTTGAYEKPTADHERVEDAVAHADDGRTRLTRLPLPDERDRVGGLGAVQSRSYFAIRLTRTWWLWGLDSQLDKPIDAVQLRYFRDAAALVGADEKIVLCTATPSWLHVRHEGAEADSPLFTLDWFLDRMPDVRHKVRLVLTGDKHHYAHYEPHGSHDAPHLVTCGGGGAFLSSTHHLPERLDIAWGFSGDQVQPPTTYTRSRTFPDAETESRGLSGGGAWLRVPFINGKLPVLVAALHAVMLLSTYWGWRSVRTLSTTYDAHRWPVTWPILWAVVVMLALLGILYAFAAHGARGTGRSPWPPAGLHAAAQWVPSSWAGFALAGGGDLTLVWGWGIVVWAALTGWGLFVLAAYLHLCDAAGYHELESYSGLRIEDYKCHLRVHLDGDAVVVHALGIRDVPSFGDAPLDQEVRLEHLETVRIT